MRGPPIPENASCGRLAFSAAIRCAASWSPEASPATMATRVAVLPTALADQAALGALEEREQRPHFRASGRLLGELALGFLQREPRAVQRAVGAPDARDALRRKPAAPQPLAVDAVGLGHVAGGLDVGRQILGEVGAHAREAVRADVHELVHQGGAAEDHPVADVHVPRQPAVVGEDAMAADLAVVREMHAGHDPVVVADARDARVARRPAIDGHALADRVAVADLDRRVLARVFLVLRRRADRAELIDAVVAPDARAPVEHHVRADPAALAHLDALADDGVGAHRDAWREPRARVDHGRGMDLRRAHARSSARSVHRISASAFTTPPTRDTQANFQMPRLCARIVASISSWSPGTIGRLNLALSMPA